MPSKPVEIVSQPRAELSVVIPMFNESGMLDTLFRRLENVLESIDLSSEVILIDDGSTDNTWLEISNYQPHAFTLHCIALSRNFGKEAALTAGLQSVDSNVVIILDADCQDPPELIPQMLEVWKDGADVVNMKRRVRHGETWIKRRTAGLYYRILGALSDTPIPKNVGDFRLLSRRVIDEVNRLKERNRYMKGILSWPGFNQVTIEYDRDPRAAGDSKWNYWQLFFLAISGITAFSNKPLRLASLMGLLIALSAFVYGLWVVIKTLVFGDTVPGYPSMMVVMLFIGGIELITIGILGEYVGRIFTEVKGRPNYIIRSNKIIAPQQNRDEVLQAVKQEA
jgi:glycosyltransferase involved in cell wall biosynthesis